jgi:hypothetical protein
MPAKRTSVVHVSEDYDVYIGRGKCPKTGIESPWGNPFSHKSGTLAQFKVNTRKEAMIAHRAWLPKQKELMDRIEELRGMRLGCWCKPKPCHGDNIVDILDELSLAIPLIKFPDKTTNRPYNG